jgi:hypothetical protein
MEMKKWSSKVKRVINEEGRRKSINLAIVSANNHYAGFGPGTANIFRKMVGLPEVVWSKEYENKMEGDDKSYLHSSRSSSARNKMITIILSWRKKETIFKDANYTNQL